MTWRRPALGDRPWAEKPRGAKTWSGMALLDLAPPPFFFFFLCDCQVGVGFLQ